MKGLAYDPAAWPYVIVTKYGVDGNDTQDAK